MEDHRIYGKTMYSQQPLKLNKSQTNRNNPNRSKEEEEGNDCSRALER